MNGWYRWKRVIGSGSEARRGLSPTHLLSHPGHVLGKVAHLPGQEALAFLQEGEEPGLAGVPGTSTQYPCGVPSGQGWRRGRVGALCASVPPPSSGSEAAATPWPSHTHVPQDTAGPVRQLSFQLGDPVQGT